MDITWFRAWCAELLVLLVTVLGCCVRSVDTACDLVEVSGTQYQGSREGKYENLQLSHCNNRASYVQQGSSPKNYIFFLDEGNNGWYGWMIGTVHCSRKGGIKGKDNTESPDAAKGIWEEVYRGDWVPSYHLKVKCTSAGVSTGMIAGGGVGALVFIVLLIVIGKELRQKNNKKRTTVRQNAPMNAAPLARGQGRAGHPPQNMRQQMTPMSSTTMYCSAQQQSQPFNNQTLFYSAQSGMPYTQQGAPGTMRGGPNSMQAPPAYSTVYGPPPDYDTLSQQ